MMLCKTNLTRLVKTQLFLMTLTSAWCIGIGLRMLLMSETDIYRINLFDQIFDWGVLLVLGLLMMLLSIHIFVKEK